MTDAAARPVPSATLRRVRAQDAPAVLDAFASAPDMGRQGEVGTLEEAQRYVERLTRAEGSVLGSAVVVDGEMVGMVGVEVDGLNRSGWVRYWMHAEHRGRGLMARAVATVAGFALAPGDGGLERLELGHRVSNPASGAVARAAGFVQEGVEREKFLIEDERVDVHTYGRLRSDTSPPTRLLPLTD